MSKIKILRKLKSGRGWIYIINCLECGKEMKLTKTQYERKGKFCSPECYFKNRSGEKHWNWKGGDLQYFKKVTRKKILERDGYKCKECKLIDRDIMEVDHIISIGIDASKMNDLNNLQCLCPNCHRRKSLRDAKLYRGARC